jgi:hypothetical protein
MTNKQLNITENRKTDLEKRVNWQLLLTDYLIKLINVPQEQTQEKNNKRYKKLKQKLGRKQ